MGKACALAKLRSTHARTSCIMSTTSLASCSVTCSRSSTFARAWKQTNPRNKRELYYCARTSRTPLVPGNGSPPYLPCMNHCTPIASTLTFMRLLPWSLTSRSSVFLVWDRGLDDKWYRTLTAGTGRWRIKDQCQNSINLGPRYIPLFSRYSMSIEGLQANSMFLLDCLTPRALLAFML